jgi:DNA polymerase (family 10)
MKEVSGVMSQGRKILRAKAIEIAAPIAAALNSRPGTVDVILAGSIRRNRPEVGDVDITVIMNGDGSPLTLWAALDDIPHDNVRGGDCERSVVVRGLKMEIRIFSPDQRGAALLFSTGSGEFNRGMRTIAKAQNRLLNRYGLWTRDRSRLIASRSEEEIFVALDLPYMPPQIRDDRIWKHLRR